MVSDLGVSDEANADGQFSLHVPRQGLGVGLPLVLQVEDMEDPVHLRRDLLPGVTLQLETTEEEGETLEKLSGGIGL